MALSIGELPGGKILQARLLALFDFGVRTLRPAFLVIDVAKRIAKHFLLLGAMLAPIEAVHGRLLLGQALGETVINAPARLMPAVPDAHSGGNSGQTDHELENFLTIRRRYGGRFRRHALSQE